jgi:hypothetical protein
MEKVQHHKKIQKVLAYIFPRWSSGGHLVPCFFAMSESIESIWFTERVRDSRCRKTYLLISAMTESQIL